MKNIAVLCALLIVGGCASSNVDERIAALEARLDQVEQTAGSASTMNRDAQSKASSAATAAQQAQRTAQQALDAAREASERANRISNECCAPK